MGCVDPETFHQLDIFKLLFNLKSLILIIQVFLTSPSLSYNFFQNKNILHRDEGAKVFLTIDHYNTNVTIFTFLFLGTTVKNKTAYCILNLTDTFSSQQNGLPNCIFLLSIWSCCLQLLVSWFESKTYSDSSLPASHVCEMSRFGCLHNSAATWCEYNKLRNKRIYSANLILSCFIFNSKYLKLAKFIISPKFTVVAQWIVLFFWI